MSDRLLGKSIAKAGGGGITASYDEELGQWIIYNDGADGQQNGKVLTASNAPLGKSLVLLPDWIDESNISDSGFSEAAADAFFASLVQINVQLGGKVFVSPLHFIAHSRGASVNSEIIQRLGTYFPNLRVRMTTLDPHDFKQPALDIPAGKLAEAVSEALLVVATKNLPAAEALNALIKPFLSVAIGAVDASTIAYAEFLDPNVVRWSNVTFADNYYQTLGAFADDKFTVTPNGEFKRDFDINIQLNGRAGFTQDDFGFFGIGGPHSRVWKWYAGTVDLSLQEFANDQIFRSLADQEAIAFSSVVPTFKYNDRPWYASQEANAINALTGYTNPESYIWEGIGTGWAFSPQGGVQLANQPPTIVLHPVTDNNTEVPKGIDPAVPSIFNGNFEYGNLHPDARYPGLVTRDSLSTPGWSFHGGSIEAKSDSVVPDGTGDYAVELRTDPTSPNSSITHNRFYISKDATSLEFFYSVKDVERAAFPNVRTGQLSAFLTVGGQERFLGDVLFDSPEVLQETDPAAWHKRTLSLPQSLLLDQQGNRVDAIGTLTFRLSYPGEQAPLVSGVGRIWLDDIALVKQSGSRNFAPGAPLLAEGVGQAEQIAQVVDTQSLRPIVNVALSQWQGMGLSSVIVPPTGSSGVQLGFGQNTAVDFLVNMDDPNEGPESHRNAGIGEGSFNEQLLFEDIITGTMVARSNYWALSQGGGHRRGYPRTPVCDQW